MFLFFKSLSNINRARSKIFYFKFKNNVVVTVPVNMFEVQSFGQFDFALKLWFAGESQRHSVLLQDSIQKLTQSTDLHYDV
jgi:hypothetical protein